MIVRLAFFIFIIVSKSEIKIVKKKLLFCVWILQVYMIFKLFVIFESRLELKHINHSEIFKRFQKRVLTETNRSDGIVHKRCSRLGGCRIFALEQKIILGQWNYAKSWTRKERTENPWTTLDVRLFERGSRKEKNQFLSRLTWPLNLNNFQARQYRSNDAKIFNFAEAEKPGWNIQLY